MKEETDISPIKLKEASKKHQNSTYDFIKYGGDNDQDVDQSKNRFNSILQQKEFNIIQSIDKLKVQSPQQIQQQAHFNFNSNHHTSIYVRKQSYNDEDSFSSEENIPFYKRYYQFISQYFVKIAKLENICKENISPYWRNKLLLFVLLSFLMFANLIHMYLDYEDNKNNPKRITLFSLIGILLVFSIVILQFRNKTYPTSSTSTQPLLQSCFTDSHFIKKIFAQICIALICIFMFILYAKCIQDNYIKNSSTKFSQSLSLQILEVLLFYQYASTFFLSFYILKMAFMISTFLVNFFFLDFQSNTINYYYIGVIIIQLIYDYEQTIISEEIHSQQTKQKYIQATTTIPTENKQNLKQPIIATSNVTHQNNYTDMFKKELNNLQYQTLQTESQKLQNNITSKHPKINHKNSNHVYEENWRKISSMEGVGVGGNPQYTYNELLKQIPSTNLVKKSSQKTITQDELNMQTHQSQRMKKTSRKMDSNIQNESESLNDINDFRSQKKPSGPSGVVSGSFKSNKTRNNTETKKPSNQENVLEDINNHDNDDDNISLNSIDKIRVCNSEPSNHYIKSQKIIQNENSNNSQNEQNMKKVMCLSSEISPMNRQQRNFSLFRREQEQNQQEIEEQASSEEADTYILSPIRLDQKLEYFGIQRSNSLGMLQKKKQKNQISSVYTASLHHRNSLINQQHKLQFSFTERSEDEEFSNSYNQRDSQWEFSNESKINVSHKISVKQYHRNRQVSMEQKKEKQNGYPLSPLGFHKTLTSTHSMNANAHQKTKLYKNILKYIPEEGVVLIDKDKNIHFANLYIQQLFPKTNYLFLFNELIQLKNIEALEDYNQCLKDILDHKTDEQQNDQKSKNNNIIDNLTKVQLTDSISSNQYIQEQNTSPQFQNSNPQQAQMAQINNFFSLQNQQKQQSKSSIKNNSQLNNEKNTSNQQSNNNTLNNNVQQAIKNLIKDNNSALNTVQSQINFVSNNQSPNPQMQNSQNCNIPIGNYSNYVPPFSSSTSVNPRLSQSNYFMKLDLFKKAKENIQLKETIIKCKSFLEQFQQIIENFRHLQTSYKKYGIASQNKFTTLLYRPLNKQESIEDVQIFEVQLIPCFLGYKEGVVVTLRDVTHFNQIKVLKDINEKKSNILRNVSHELRQPLNCIISMMQLTRDSYTDQTLIQEYINPTLYSCQILLNLLNDFLDFSQIQAGTFKLTNVYFNIKKLFQNIFQMMKAQIQIRSLNFILNIANENDIPDEIKSDPHRIQQIITNLLGNAVKFTEEGDIVLTLEKISNNIYKISVADSGIGITEEGQKNLFKTFGKVDQERKSVLNPQGVGLGLMISNILAQQLGPTEDKGLQVESKIGYGTKFYFYLQDNAFQDRELVSFTPFNGNKDKQISPQNMQMYFPYVRRATSRNMETSVLFQQQQPLDSQEDCCANSIQIVLTPRNMITRQSYLNQVNSCKSNQSFDNIQEQVQPLDFNFRHNVLNNVHKNINENNIQKIDQNNIQKSQNINFQQDNTYPPSNKKSYNIVISTKLLDYNIEGLQEKEFKGQNSIKKKQINQLQQSQLITQGIALRQQTLILQQEFSPRAQKQFQDEIINYSKQKQQKCQQCSSKDILIVDDNDFNIYVLDKYLKSFQIEADSSTNGASSEKKVKDKIELSKCDDCKVYKIIFMDLDLGQQSGITVANNIVQIYCQYRLFPPVLIACTGHVDENTVQDCFNNGFHDFLAKPIMKDQLVQILQKYLKIEQ